MMGRVHIDVPIERIAAFCEKWKIREFALFGSVLREDFSTHSDIDVLVTFSEDAEHSLFDLVHMEDELEALFGRSVDVVSRRGVEASRNYIRKNTILNSAEPIYAS
jgi:predicted nucleotidyltransferase